MVGAIDNGFEARRWGSKNAYCGRRYKGVCRSRLPAASPSPLAAVRTEIASPGIEPGDFLASQRKPRARPLGQAGPAGSGFSNWSSHHIGAEAIPDGFGVSMFHILQRHAQQTMQTKFFFLQILTLLVRAEPYH